MSFKNDKNSISTYKELNFIISEAIEKLEKGLLTEEEYNKIILTVETEIKKIQSTKKELALKEFFWRIIN